MKPAPKTLLAAAVALSALQGGCGSGFDPANEINSVRVLAVRADRPYATPGETVNLEALAFDGRPVKPSPMKTFWVPVICPNPPGDAYYGCYPAFAKLLKPRVDLGSRLVEGARFSFRMPDDVISAHDAPKQGPDYGVVVVFLIACAGHVEYVPLSLDTLPPRPPLACFDAEGRALGPEDWVFSYARVFSFTGRTNENPVLDHLLVDQERVDPAKGITVEACPETDDERCASREIEAVVPAKSQEIDPSDVQADGTVAREQVWVDYYLTGGSMKETALLYGATTGKREDTAAELRGPVTSGEHTLWAVARDNRGGVSWLAVPMHAK